MRIAVGADHAGFPLKEPVIAELERLGDEVVDLGTHNEEPADYPDYAQKVAEAVMRGEAERGLLLCGSGVGTSVAANKVPGVRAAVCHDTFSAHPSSAWAPEWWGRRWLSRSSARGEQPSSPERTGTCAG
jgi:ribose 5-phosphate isomerase B